MPTLYAVITQSFTREGERLSKCRETGALTAISKLCFIYNQCLSSYVKIQGLRLLKAGCNKAGMEAACKLYDSVSYPTVNRLLDTYSQEADKDIEKMSGQDVIHVGDNVDKRQKKRHELAASSFKDYHMYNNLIYKARIPTSHLSDIPPTPPKTAEDVDYSKFVASASDQSTLITRMYHLVADVWCNVKSLSEASSKLKKFPAHKYQAEMNMKSEKVLVNVYFHVYLSLEKQLAIANTDMCM